MGARCQLLSGASSEPRTQRSGVSGRPMPPLTPLRCVRGSEVRSRSTPAPRSGAPSMSRKRKETPLSQRAMPGLMRDKARGPLAVVLGSPAEVAHCLSFLGGIETTCYQMDLHQADRLQAELAQQQTAA